VRESTSQLVSPMRYDRDPLYNEPVFDSDAQFDTALLDKAEARLAELQLKMP